MNKSFIVAKCWPADVALKAFNIRYVLINKRLTDNKT